MHSNRIDVMPSEFGSQDWADDKTEFKTDLLQDYFLFITEDNVEGVRDQVFSSITPGEKGILLNGKFDFGAREVRDAEGKDAVKGKRDLYILRQLRVCRPISLAVAYGSVGVFGYLLEEGADLFVPKEEGLGIVNIMIAAAHASPDLEDNMLKMYGMVMSRYPEPSQRKQLLLEESEGELCPLETAIKLRTYELFKSILYTDGVFLEIKSQNGKVVEYEFNLSIYERTGKRCETLPLYFLDNIRFSEMEKFVESGIMTVPVIKAWIARKIAWSRPILLLWGLLRCIWPIVFFIYESQFVQLDVEQCTAGKNGSTDYMFNLITTNESTPWRLALVWSSVIMAVPTLITDIFELILLVQKRQNYCNQYRGLSTKSACIVDCRVFRVAQLLLGTSSVALAFSQMADSQTNYLFLVLITTVIRFLMLFSLLFFAQVIPVLGFFIIGFQQMIIALLNFIMLFFTVLILFMTLFQGIGMYLCKMGGAFTKCGGSTEFYDTFLVLLNMIPIHEEECTLSGMNLMQSVHMLYIFIISVLIVNYLIALMSTVYSNLSQYQDQVSLLYHLYFANLSECRLRCFLKCCHLNKNLFKDTPLIIKTTEIDTAIKTYPRNKKMQNRNLAFSKL